MQRKHLLQENLSLISSQNEIYLLDMKENNQIEERSNSQILILRPIEHAILELFKTSDGSYSIIQPVKHAFWIPVNAMLISLDVLAPINRTGGFGLPLKPFFERAMRKLRWLAKSFDSSIPRIDRATLVLAVVVGELSAIFTRNQSMQWSGGYFSNDQFSLQKFFASELLSYILATNAYAMGEDLILNFSKWYKKMWADSQCEQLMRHLNQLTQIKHSSERQKFIENYELTVAAGKDWNYIDLAGRFFEGVLSAVFALPQRAEKNLHEITLFSDWCNHNPFVQKSVNTAKNVVNKCISIVNFFRRNAESHYMDYDLLLDKYKKESCKQGLSSRLSFFASQPTTLLNQALIEQYKIGVSRSKNNKPPGLPLMPKTPKIKPRDTNWETLVKDNNDIQAMLKGRFPDDEASVAEKAYLYNKALYSIYTTGQFMLPEKLVENNMQKHNKEL